MVRSAGVWFRIERLILDQCKATQLQEMQCLFIRGSLQTEYAMHRSTPYSYVLVS